MLYTEFNMEDAKSVWLEEGMEKGKAEGMEKGRAEGMEKVFALLEKGVPLAEAKRQLSEP
jgi:flagellar biosynthesis/type III secretory pathway protein FliH